MTAEVKVSGPATLPSITLSSSPPYPSDEILARLLFGKSLETLTPLQALQLAQAVRTLAGGGGLDVFGKTRKLLGMDQLELMQSDEDEGEAAIRAGKYINDRIYFQVEQGVGSASSKASVEVELSPNLSLETEIGADSGGGVGVKWRWDY
jgi:translocation and assembly module TamB